jgi:thiamine biosynthesis protein ThiS
LSTSDGEPVTPSPDVLKALNVVGATMKLWVNGEERAVEAVADVAGLVASLGLDVRKVAVERNLEIVPRSIYATTPIADGDRIEIVHFIGGG